MRKKLLVKIIAIIIPVVIVFQAGLIAYSMVDNNSVSLNLQKFFNPIAFNDTSVESTLPESTPDISEPDITPAITPAIIDTSNIIISDEIINMINQSDPINFDKNLSNYKLLLVKLNVHDNFKSEIERLIIAGHKLPDILIAYEFLSDSYAKIEQLERLVIEKESGKSWAMIFKIYNQNSPEFVPGSFDSDYLEKLMKTPGLNKDDIMIGDRVSQKIQKPFQEVIELKITGKIWRDINAEFGIMSGQNEIPHVLVTTQQVQKYTKDGKFTESKVVQTLVLACKLDRSPDEMIEKAKAGLSKEELYAFAYEQKYY